MRRSGFLAAQRSLLVATMTLPLAVSSGLQAQTQWVPIEEITNTQPQSQSSWEIVEPSTGSSPNLVWEPLTPKEESLSPEELVWTKPTNNRSIETPDLTAEQKEDSDKEADTNQTDLSGFRWPNGQLMSDADQIYYRQASCNCRRSLGQRLQNHQRGTCRQNC